MSQTQPTSGLTQTPQTGDLLESLRRRLVRQVLMHGLGTVLGVATAWLLFAYIADWGLRVPKVVRVFHGGTLFVLVAFFSWRNILRPLGRLPSRAGLAVLLERANPELREVLVSAVQFQEREGAHGDPEMIRLVLAEAEERARGLSTKGVLEEEAPRARFLLGAGGVVALVLLAAFNRGQAGIFFDRLFGGNAIWPQRTYLAVDVPGLEIHAETPDLIQLRVARGTDVPIRIQAEGVVPDEVRLHFSGSRDQVLTGAGGGLFRTLVQSCQEDFSFHVTGGDDNDGIPVFQIDVLQPPDVEGVAAAIQPPAYSQLPPTVVFNRDVEVLFGSVLRIHVRPFPQNATGMVRLLPSDLLEPLQSAPFPVDPDLGDALDPGPGLYFDHVAQESISYRIELTDDTGLQNPDPGLYRIQVIEDRPPEIQVLAPGRTDFEVVRGGAIPLRARVEDDYGILSMGWRISPDLPGTETEPVVEGEFALIELDREALERTASGERRSGARKVALGNAQVEVDSLGTEATPVSVDQRYLVELVALDNREPAAGEGRSLPIRARVVTPEELLRRMQDRLAQARLDALRLSDLQREKRQRVEELIDSAEDDGAQASGEALALAAALSGQRRVLGDAQALARELAGVSEDILYARLDEKAGALLAYYDARMAEVTDLRFHSEPWRELAAASANGQLGTSGFAGSLVQLVALALEITEDHARAGVAALDEAEQALDAATRQAALLRAEAAQSSSLARIEDLLQELAEWDNFQNILALTRDILNRQKALRERTQQFATEK